MAGSGSTADVDGDGTQLVLGSLRLVLIDLGQPHVAFVSPQSESVLVCFAVGNRKPPCKLGFIAIGQRDFVRYARALLGREVDLTPSARLLRLPAAALREIRRLHAQAFRLHVTKPALLARREVARALEQDLLHALLDGMGTAEPAMSEG